MQTYMYRWCHSICSCHLRTILGPFFLFFPFLFLFLVRSFAFSLSLGILNVKSLQMAKIATDPRNWAADTIYYKSQKSFVSRIENDFFPRDRLNSVHHFHHRGLWQSTRRKILSYSAHSTRPRHWKERACMSIRNRSPTIFNYPPLFPLNIRDVQSRVRLPYCMSASYGMVSLILWFCEKRCC